MVGCVVEDHWFMYASYRKNDYWRHLALVLAIVLPGSSVYAFDSLVEPGTLLSVETKDGKTVERYSDGLIVELSPNGERDERREQDQQSMHSCMPSGYGVMPPSEDVDSFIDSLIGLAGIYGPNNSQLQSRLREYSVYFLRMKEPSKAEPLAEEYLHIQKVLHTKNPLAFAQRNLGEVKSELGKYQEAAPLFEAAASFYKGAQDQMSYCNALNGWGLALIKSGRAQEAIKPLDDCIKVASEHSLPTLEKQAVVNRDLAQKLVSDPKKD